MDTNDLISKKDLLEITGISYGQLYRWKRKGLIPEDWFIKKSAYTGQETFFPRLKMLSRVEKIKNMKEDISLDDLAEVFSPVMEELTISKEEIIQRGIVSVEVIKIFGELQEPVDDLDFNHLLMIYILDRLIIAGEIGLDEAKTLSAVLKEATFVFGTSPYKLFLTRKLGVFCCFAAEANCKVVRDQSERLIAQINTAVVTEELKLKIM